MDWITSKDFKLYNTCVAFGRFDGLHRGHRVILNQIVRQESLSPVLLSLYANHDVLTTEEEKRYLLKDSGLSTMISLPESQLESLSPEKFVEEILVGRLGAKLIVAGKGCYCGAVDLEELLERHGCRLMLCNILEDGGEMISSALVRHELEACKLKRVESLLSYPYLIMGKIVHGKALGRTVGMPTANLEMGKSKLTPPHGVYASLTHIEGTCNPGLTNIGMRPSVDNFNYVTVETFLLDFDSDIYDKTVTLELLDYIRGVTKFANLEEVKKQVEKDIIKTRESLSMT